MTMFREKVYKMALEKYGSRAQMEMAQEEAIELALAFRKQVRNNNNVSFTNMVEEIADIEIMIDQVELIHGGDEFREIVEAQKEFKINRLLDRIGNKA